MTLIETLRTITPLDSIAMQEARKILDGKVKPVGSLGTLEDIAIRIAGITGKTRNTFTHKVICLFGSDHGIYEEGVCSSPQEVTRALMHVYAYSKNGGINVLARQAGAELRIYDLGVKGLAKSPNIITHKFLPEGTANFLHGPAMTPELAERVIMFGIELARELKAEGVDVVGTGEVGMANTTPACACIMAATGSRDASLVGHGAGLDDESYARKQKVILEALTLHENNLVNPLYIIANLGGLDIAAMTGLFIGAAAQKFTIIIDGVISIAAALLAYQLEPLTREYMLASHESLEPAYTHAAKFMGLIPALRLSMRLGEGTGCAVFMQIIDDALAIINGMGEFATLPDLP